MNYLHQYEQAVTFSIQHGLLDSIQTQELPLSKEQIIEICCNFFKMKGYTSDKLAFNCPIIHFKLSQILKMHGVLSEVTIGQLIYKGKPVIRDFSVQRLLDDLYIKVHSRKIYLHCWLTLSDGTILDFTHLAGEASNRNKIKKLANCYIWIPKNKPDIYHNKYRYQPKIVGHDYLLRVNAFNSLPFFL